jgi:hypothetical protein
MPFFLNKCNTEKQYKPLINNITRQVRTYWSYLYKHEKKKRAETSKATYKIY